MKTAFRRGLLLSAGTVLLLSMACSKESPAPPVAEGPVWFKDVTDEVGIDFVHDAGPTGKYFMPQIIGSGAAVLDFDQDGRLDILLLQNGGPASKSTNRLYRQMPDGKLRDVSAGSGLDFAGYNMGVAVGDVNNDGRPDVLITQYGGIKLLTGDGKGRFEDVTRRAGLDQLSWATAASFFDYDKDGWLDLIVVNYLDYDPSSQCLDGGGRPDYCHPQTFAGVPARLFRNACAQGPIRFEDVSLRSGIGQVPGPGLGVLCADLTGDGWPDIFVANDAHANFLWVNQGNGTFTEEALLRGVAFNRLSRPQGNMGIAVGDVDGDGRFDLFVTHLTEETNALWRQVERGQFLEDTAAWGLSQSAWRGTGFGTVFADFDHDGSLDLALVNGRVFRKSGATSTDYWGPYAERHQLFAGTAANRYRDISEANFALSGKAEVARALVCADLDGDGAMDLLLTTIAGRARLLRNVAPERGHWLIVRAVDPGLNRDAYGAEITVHAGGKRWLRLIQPGYSYLASNDPRAHFGLGAVDRIDRIEVLWPDGSREAFREGLVDRALVLSRGKGERL